MNEIKINDKISYIKAYNEPLSADIGIIRADGKTWLFDVGCGEKAIEGIRGAVNVVLSHFHQDHTANVDKLQIDELFGSKETCAHVGFGTVVSDDIFMGSLHIFPLPSSHAKGCLGLEIDGTYAFVGDALYSRSKDGKYVYNVQFLKAEIETLKKLKASLLLVSHFDGLVRNKDEVILELEEIYKHREKGSSLIEIDRN